MRHYLAYGHQRVRMRRLFALNHGMDAAMLLGFMVTYPNVNIPIICLQVNSLAQNTLWNLINLKEFVYFYNLVLRHRISRQKSDRTLKFILMSTYIYHKFYYKFL